MDQKEDWDGGLQTFFDGHWMERAKNKTWNFFYPAHLSSFRYLWALSSVALYLLSEFSAGVSLELGSVNGFFCSDVTYWTIPILSFGAISSNFLRRISRTKSRKAPPRVRVPKNVMDRQIHSLQGWPQIPKASAEVWDSLPSGPKNVLWLNDDSVDSDHSSCSFATFERLHFIFPAKKLRLVIN